MTTELSVNLNKIALLRNSRGRDYPSVIDFAQRVLATDAVGITMHPRPDERHARKSDIYELARLISDYSGKELNVEGYPNDEFMELVLAVKPHQCTLVPDDPNQVTSDHGWNLSKDFDLVKRSVDQLNQAGIRTAIFMDPAAEHMPAAAKTGAARIELYTEAYACAYGQSNQDEVLAQYVTAAQAAQAEGLEINAGHDLNLQNLGCFLQAVNDVKEVSIGHAITIESLEYGFANTLERYLAIAKNLPQTSE